LARDFDPYDYSAEAMQLSRDDVVIEESKVVKVAKAARTAKDPKYLQYPYPVIRRLNKVTLPATRTIYDCLVYLEYKAVRKGQPLVLSNKLLIDWKISRWQKYRGLAELGSGSDQGRTRNS